MVPVTIYLVTGVDGGIFKLTFNLLSQVTAKVIDHLTNKQTVADALPKCFGKFNDVNGIIMGYYVTYDFLLFIYFKIGRNSVLQI